jgi:hypothetical protein
MVNKQVTGSYSDTLPDILKYNRVAGLEYNLANPDNRLTGKAFYHQSFYPGATANAAAAGAKLTYNSQYLKASLDQSWIGADYNAETGYIRRTGYYEISPSASYLFYMPSESKVLNHGPGVNFDMIFDPNFTLTDRQIQLSYSIGWQNKSQLTVHLIPQIQAELSFPQVKISAGQMPELVFPLIPASCFITTLKANMVVIITDTDGI